MKSATERLIKRERMLGFHSMLSLPIKNDNPALLMEVAEWWIMKHKLDHFEKAIKIKEMVESNN